jgi:hypothetical protein
MRPTPARTISRGMLQGQWRYTGKCACVYDSWKLNWHMYLHDLNKAGLTHAPKSIPFLTFAGKCNSQAERGGGDSCSLAKVRCVFILSCVVQCCHVLPFCHCTSEPPHLATRFFVRTCELGSVPRDPTETGREAHEYSRPTPYSPLCCRALFWLDFAQASGETESSVPELLLRASRYEGPQKMHFNFDVPLCTVIFENQCWFCAFIHTSFLWIF